MRMRSELHARAQRGEFSCKTCRSVDMATQHNQTFSSANQCPVCNMTLASRQSLRRHWNNWHGDCDKGILEEHLRQFDRVGKNYVCPACGKAFSRSNILKDHQEKIHQQQGLKRAPRFQCTITGCPLQPFYFLKDLLQHYELAIMISLVKIKLCTTLYTKYT